MTTNGHGDGKNKRFLMKEKVLNSIDRNAHKLSDKKPDHRRGNPFPFVRARRIFYD